MAVYQNRFQAMIKMFFEIITLSIKDSPSPLTADTSFLAVDLFDWRLNGVMGLDEFAILLCYAVYSTYSDWFRLTS